MLANRLVAAALLSVLTGCGGSGGTEAVQPKAAGDPEALVGSWFVAAAGEEAHAILTIGGGLSLSRECGTLNGGWRMNEGRGLSSRRSQ